VEVFDSSAIHHDDDSRPQGTGGVGKGIITFEVNRAVNRLVFNSILAQIFTQRRLPSDAS
jgi:hypothetical protein